MRFKARNISKEQLSIFLEVLDTLSIAAISIDFANEQVERFNETATLYYNFLTRELQIYDLISQFVIISLWNMKHLEILSLMN